MRYKFSTGSVALLGWLMCNAQQPDSLLSTKVLKEVIITDKAEDNNHAFSFYRNSKVATTEDILSRIEGVNLIRRGAFGMEPMLRTYQGGQLNTLINGMRMYGACTDKMDPISSYVEPANLAKLSLQHGAANNQLGSSLGGTINFELSEAQVNCHKPIWGQVYTQYSHVNRGVNTGFYINYSKQKWATRISGAFRKAQPYYAGNSQPVNHSQYQKFNTHISWTYALKPGRKLLIDAIVDQGTNIGYPSLPMDVSLARAWMGSITYRKQHSSNDWETKLYANQVVHTMDDTKRSETIIHMDMPGWSNTVGFYSRLNWLKNTFELAYRIDGHHAYTRADMTMYPTGEKEMYMQTLPGNNLSNLGSSLNLTQKLKRQKRLQYNVRVDGYRQQAVSLVGKQQWAAFGSNVSDAKYNLTLNGGTVLTLPKNNHYFQFSAAYAQRLPTSNERIGFYLFNRADGFDYLGNYSLKPENALQGEVKWRVKKKIVDFSITIFYHHINHYIYAYALNGYSPMTIGARGVKAYRNISYADLYGAEAVYKYRLSRTLHYQGNMRYTLANLSTGLPMQQVPPLKLLNTFRYQTDSLQLQLEHQFAAAQHRINTDFGERSTKAWQTVSLRAAYTQTWKKYYVQWNVAIENIFNTYYREHLDWGNLYQPGRNCIVGINFIMP